MKEDNKYIKIIILVLVLICLAIGAYFLFFTNNNEEKTPEENNLEEVAEILINKVNEYHLYNIDENKNIVTYNSVPTQESLYAMFDYYRTKEKIGDITEYKLSSSISKEQVDSYFKNVYNLELSDYPDYQCWEDGKALYAYDSNKKVYQFDSNEHGHGDPHDGNKAILLDIEKDPDDTYTITVLKINITEGGFLVGNEFFDSIENIEKTVKDNSKYQSYRPQYKYTFKKDNNNYYLYKLETIK